MTIANESRKQSACGMLRLPRRAWFGAAEQRVVGRLRGEVEHALRGLRKMGDEQSAAELKVLDSAMHALPVPELPFQVHEQE